MLQINCPSWFKTAPCQGNSEIFFSTKPSDRRKAASICKNVCSHSDECAKIAISNGTTIGVWGGLTGPELVRLQSGSQ